MSKIKLIALFGESGTGKDYLRRRFIQEYNWNKVVPITTRPPRPDEVPGSDYNFLSEQEFKKLIEQNKLLEYTQFNNWYYSSGCLDYLKNDQINIGIFNPSGLRKILDKDNLSILPLWITTDKKIRLLRAIHREDNPDCNEICRRFLADEKDFSNIDFDYVKIDNNNYNNLNELIQQPKIHSFIVGQF